MCPLSQPGLECSYQQPPIQSDDDRCNYPGQRGQRSAVYEFSHLPALAGEVHQWNHRERELQAQYDLAEYEQPTRATFTIHRSDEHSRHDGDQPRNEPPEPGRKPYVEESFHYDLPSQSAGDGAVLT